MFLSPSIIKFLIRRSIRRSVSMPVVSDMTERKCDYSCAFWTYDMDGTYCAHAMSFEIAPTFGASTNRMSLEGHCSDNFDDKSKNTLALWVPRK